MENYYKYWLHCNPQQRLTAEDEKYLGEKIQSGLALREKGSNLTRDEETICSEGREAMKKLIECNIPLGVYFANKYAEKYPELSLSVDDLSQEALLGIMKAAERYDPKAQCKFSTYAAFWIGQTIRRAIEDKSDTIRKPASAHSRARLVHKVESESGTSLDAAAISEITGLSEEEVEFIRILDRQKITSIDQSFFGDDDDEQSYHETIASPSNIEEEATYRIEHELLSQLIRAIPDPDVREIMLMHLGMYENGIFFSSKSIALIKHKKESEIVSIISHTEHELCRWQAVHNSMNGRAAQQ